MSFRISVLPGDCRPLPSPPAPRRNRGSPPPHKNEVPNSLQIIPDQAAHRRISGLSDPADPDSHVPAMQREPEKQGDESTERGIQFNSTATRAFVGPEKKTGARRAPFSCARFLRAERGGAELRLSSRPSATRLFALCSEQPVHIQSLAVDPQPFQIVIGPGSLEKRELPDRCNPAAPIRHCDSLRCGRNGFPSFRVLQHRVRDGLDLPRRVAGTEEEKSARMQCRRRPGPARRGLLVLDSLQGNPQSFFHRHRRDGVYGCIDAPTQEPDVGCSSRRCQSSDLRSGNVRAPASMTKTRFPGGGFRPDPLFSSAGDRWRQSRRRDAICGANTVRHLHRPRPAGPQIWNCTR